MAVRWGARPLACLTASSLGLSDGKLIELDKLACGRATGRNIVAFVEVIDLAAN